MIDYAPLVFRVEPMRSEDIGQVMEIEHVAFSAPWSARAYDYELHYNEMARYFVARPQEDGATVAMAEEEDSPRGSPARRSVWKRLFAREPQAAARRSSPRLPVVGYGGFWLMVDEAHISTIAAHPAWRRHGVGELLLLSMIDGAAEMGASVVTLEVRVSNVSALALYRKYGFQAMGVRKGYYSDNGEDALVMTTPRLGGAEFVRHVQGQKAVLFGRLARHSAGL